MTKSTGQTHQINTSTMDNRHKSEGTEMKGSLGHLVEHFEGKKGDEKKYSRAYVNWIRFLNVILSKREAKFVNSLSGAQALSGHLLNEWWFAKTQHPDLSKAAETLICTTATREKLANNQAFNKSIEDSINLIKSVCKKYEYHEELFLLWQVEFLFSYDGVDETSLQRHRYDAALIASCQRTAWGIFQQCFREETLPIPERALFGATTSGTFNQNDTVSEYRQRGMSWVTVPCPWLNVRATNILNFGTRKDLPKYLWDRNQGCTVEVTSLSYRPAYTIISHTWGRWKINPICWVSVEGVNWRVPQNTRFDIRDLPNVIRAMDILTDYVWIDLFCIPQDRSDPVQAHDYNIEVDHQAVIFANAASGAIWLNDVKSWDGLQDTVKWLCLQYLLLVHPNSLSLLGAKVINSINETSRPSGLYNISDDRSMPEPSGWFSSLWTLQEACLRPHMELLNREGKAMFIGAETLALDGLLALAEWVRIKILTKYPFLQEIEIRIPQGPSELYSLSDNFQLAFLININPLQVLGMTGQRVCKRGRARAIMSALGATSWWSEHVRIHGQPPPETELVLGRFPLTFVQEIRDQLGAAFFGSVSFSDEYRDVGSHEHDRSSRLGYAVIGSMMPFSSNPARKRGSYVWGSEFQDHPTVCGWKILPDGCVKIDEAGIVAAKVAGDPLRDQSKTDLTATIMAPGKSEHMNKVQHVNLKDWLEMYQPDVNLYAVSLCYGGPKGNDWGVILQGVTPWRLGSTPPSMLEQQPPREQELLVKVGAYIIKNKVQNLQPETVRVNWLVL